MPPWARSSIAVPCPLPAVAIAGRRARLIGIVFLRQHRAQFRFYQRQAFLAGFLKIAFDCLELAVDSSELGAALIQPLVMSGAISMRMALTISSCACSVRGTALS